MTALRHQFVSNSTMQHAANCVGFVYMQIHVTVQLSCRLHQELNVVLQQCIGACEHSTPSSTIFVAEN